MCADGDQSYANSTVTSTDGGLSFSEFLNNRSSTVSIHEPQLEKRDKQARAQLRSISFFEQFGFDRVVHTELWDNDFKPLDYEHISSEEVVDDAGSLEFPLVHIVTQDGITEYGEESLVRTLVRRSIEDAERYILVTDRRNPLTPSFTKKPGKGLLDEFAGIHPRNYTDLVDRFIDENLDTALAVNKTRNLYFHQISAHHKEAGAPAGNLVDLFDYSRAPPDSPAWKPLYYFIEHDLEAVLTDYAERIREALRSWIERGSTQQIATQMLDTLRMCDYKRGELDEYRNSQRRQ
jgi:hypothetical protein